MRDPVVTELRQTRQVIADECGHDFGRILERQRQVMREWRARTVQPPREAVAVPAAPAELHVAQPDGRYAVAGAVKRGPLLAKPRGRQSQASGRGPR